MDATNEQTSLRPNGRERAISGFLASHVRRRADLGALRVRGSGGSTA
jgi:hypothetical protein